MQRGITRVHWASLSTRRRRASAILAVAGATTVWMSAASRAATDAYNLAPTAVGGSYVFSGNFTIGTTVPGSGSSAPATGDSLYFGTSTSGTTVSNDQTGFSYAGLTFNSGASAFTIGGNAFTLTGAITNNATTTQTINNAITVSGTESVNAALGGITLGGAISSGSVALTGPQAVTFSGAGSSFGALTLGTIQTSSNGNSNASSPNVVGATANLNSSASFGSLLVNAGANVINVAPGVAISNSVIANGSTSDRLTALNINLGSGATWATTATNTNGIISIGSQYNELTLNGTDFAANSGGFLAAATYTSNTATVIGSATANPTVNTTVLVDTALAANSYTNTLRFGDTTAHTLNLNTSTLAIAGNSGNGGGGAILMSAASGGIVNTITGGNFTGSSNRGLAINNYDLTAGSGLTINSNFNNFLIAGGTINSTAIVGLNGGGTITFGGNNLINGALAINNSTLIASSDANLGGTNGSISIASAPNASTAVTLSAAASLTSGLANGDVLLGQVISSIAGTSVTLTSAYTGTSVTSATNEGFAEGGAIDINGGTLMATSSFSLSEANSTGVAVVRNRAIGIGLRGGTFDVTSGNTLTVPGVITASTGASPTFAALNKTDSGTLTIAGSAANPNLFLNNIAGTTVLANTAGIAAVTTTITGGTVMIGANSGSTNQTTNVVVNGGVLDLNGFSGQPTSFATVNGTGGTITDSSTTTASTLFIGNGGGAYADTLNIASAIVNGLSRPVNVNVQGAATSTRNVVFTGNDTYTGTTTINAGTLTIDASSTGSASAALSGSTAISLGAAGQLHLLTVASGTGSGGSSLRLLNSGATITVNAGNTLPFNLELNGNVQLIGSFVLGSTAEPLGYYGSAAFFSDTGLTPADSTTESLFSGDGGLNVVGVPEPTVAASLGFLAAASLLRRRRKGLPAVG